jgi:hypothetical protein
VRWSDLVARSPQSGLAHKELGLVWFCKAYGVEAIELWFDPSPSNQLQLIWILDYLRSEPYAAERTKLRIVDFDLLGAGSARLRDHTIRQLDVTEDDFEVARVAWEAYRAPTPELCVALLSGDFPTFPFLTPAMEDLLAELPSSEHRAGRDGSATARTDRKGAQSHQGAVSAGRAARHARIRPMGAWPAA